MLERERTRNTLDTQYSDLESRRRDQQRFDVRGRTNEHSTKNLGNSISHNVNTCG